jgi:hypothetical protein
MGIQRYDKTGINKAKVNNVKAVRKILERYDSRLPLEVVADGKDGKGRLVLGRQDPFDSRWPSAVDDLPDEAFDDDDWWFDGRDELHEKLGEKGLTDLLIELAPYLDSPLIVQAASVSSMGEFGRAKEWTIGPQDKEVEVKEIGLFQDEEMVVNS